MDKEARQLYYEVLAAEAILGGRDPEEATQEEVCKIKEISRKIEKIIQEKENTK